MKRISARELLKYSIDELWDGLTGEFTLVFDDGELTTNAKFTVYSSYAWEFHRIYINTPLLLKHHVDHLLSGKRLGSDTHLDLLGNAMWSVYDNYVGNIPAQEVPAFRDQLAELVYRLTNRMYNELTYRLESHVTSIDIVDFLAVLDNTRVKAVNDGIENTPEHRLGDMPTMEAAIDGCYREITDVLLSPTEMPHNPIAQAAKSGIVSMGQVLQCLGPRGFLTDTDSHIFRYPVLRGYVRGMRTLHNSMVESRSAAKSLLFSKTPLQQAEYFSRRLQLMSQVLRNLHTGDCGSQSYLHWNVRAAVHGSDGKLSQPGDLKFLKGKYYLADDGQLKMIVGNEKHLIGKTLKLRSVIHCAHPDAYGVCSTCFGELSLSVPRDTNLGHMCCTSMTQKSTQNVLSVKHLDGSSAVDSIEVLGEDRKYLASGADETSYLLSERLKGKSVKLVIGQERAANITDILEVKNIEDLNITRVSELEEIGFMVSDGRIEERVTCFVHMGRRLASMSYPLLRYIAQHRWDVDEQGNYVIDMANWVWTDPILVLPLKHINMSDHSAEISQMLESRVEDMQSRDKGVSPDAFLVELFDLVNDKLNVNLAVLEVILYGAMIRSAENLDYALPKPWTERGLGVMKNSMAYRSGSAAMAYEGHHDFITSPMSYLLTNRVDHPLDYVLMPDKVN